MRDYIMGSQERTMPKRKTMGEYIAEAKLEALRRQFETFTTPSCIQCGLVGHESEDCSTGNNSDDYEILLDEDQHDACSSNWYIDYILPCMKHLLTGEKWRKILGRESIPRYDELIIEEH